MSHSSSKRNWTAVTLVVAAVASSSACAVESSSAPRGASEITLPGPDRVQADAFGTPTTDGNVALANLNGQIESQRQLVARFADNVDFMAGLVGLLMTRTQFSGSYDDFAEALDVSQRALSLKPGAATHALRASVLSGLHRFDEAVLELDKAEASGADVTRARETIDLARGHDLAGVLAARASRAAALPSYDNLVALAGARAAVGQYDAADQDFVAALAAYDDVSPMPVAWVAFQRGVMWAEQAARPDLAKPLYEEAVRRLPGYVVANVHLSELEVATGDKAGAMSRLDRVRVTTVDPEPTGYLAELLSATDPNLAQLHASDARKRYDALLDHYPQAFADHGSEFFSGPAGADPERGLSLALSNLALRPTDRAYLVAIDAATAAKQPALACQLVAEAGPERPNVVLQLARQKLQASHCKP
ncbi:MAG: hypothetical protein R3B13_13990 [Polyangiaceae bacterium]